MGALPTLFAATAPGLPGNYIRRARTASSSSADTRGIVGRSKAAANAADAAPAVARQRGA